MRREAVVEFAVEAVDVECVCAGDGDVVIFFDGGFGVFDDARVVVNGEDLEAEAACSARMEEPEVHIAGACSEVQECGGRCAGFEHVFYYEALEKAAVDGEAFVYESEVVEGVAKHLPGGVGTIHEFGFIRASGEVWEDCVELTLEGLAVFGRRRPRRRRSSSCGTGFVQSRYPLTEVSVVRSRETA